MEKNHTIIDPVVSYKDILKKEFSEKNEQCFTEMFQKANIDLATNKKTVSEIHKLQKQFKKNAFKATLFKILYIIILLLDIAALIVGAIFLYEQYLVLPMSNLIVLIIGLIVIVSLLTYLYIYIKKNPFKKLIEKNKVLNNQIKDKKKECYRQLAPLTNQFYDNMVDELIMEVLPAINIDKLFSIERYACMANKYSLPETPAPNESITAIKSGDIFGNPYLLLNKKVRSIVMAPYTGTRVVTWTETVWVNNKRETRTRSQVLTATINKPKPVTDVNIELYYLNTAAPELSFKRTFDNVHTLSKKKLSRHIKRHTKELEKYVLKQIKKGHGNVELLGNTEFEALFNAINRNDDIGYRILFTPLAQRNMTKLLTDEEFGDNFVFEKKRMINCIREHLSWNVNLAASEYLDISYEVVKELFKTKNEEYFYRFYKIFAPILSIPMYQENKALSYIYEDEYPFNYNPYMQEFLANDLNYNFAHPRSVNEPILKTNVVDSNPEMKKDVVGVTAYTHFIEKLVEVVPVMAANGRFYNVNVPWDNYVPISKDTRMDILKTTDSSEDDVQQKFGKGFYRYYSKRGLLSLIAGDD